MTAPAVYAFTVPGQPIGKARARVVLNRGKVRAFTPDKTARFENLVRCAFVAAYPNHVPLEGPVSVCVYAYFLPPKCFKPKGKYVDTESVPHTKRPDSDNICKSIFDAGNGVIWRDDSQIYQMHVFKFYSLTPRTEIEIGYGGKHAAS
jgi:Holliday junction resolvase RusA-like endonuclease